APLESSFGEFGGISQAAHLLVDRAGLLSYEGDAPGGWRAAFDALRLATLHGKGGELLSKAIAVGVGGRAARACLTVMLNRPGAVMPGDLAGELAAFSARPYVRDGFDADVAHGLDLYRAPESTRRQLLLELGLDPMGAALAQAVIRLFHLDSALSAVSAAESDVLARPQGWRALRSSLAVLQRERESSPFRRLVSGVFSGAPNPTLLFARGFEAKAWSNLALAFSALNAYRAARGRYPERLEDLAPRYATLDLLWDPFSNQAFRYAASGGGKGFELSSLGPFKTRTDGAGQSMVLRERY
ncbi:MAG: hypothetical protein HY925_16050, partial [Elusimicrobia bacterium]|nr:hypothetical protein [Elusimicrobiota bacterium]